jgi:hypothetical protein
LDESIEISLGILLTPNKKRFWLFQVIVLQYKTVWFQALENTEGAIKKGQFRETSNIGYQRRRQTNQKHSTICAGHHYTQANTNNVNKTCPPTNN